MFSFFKKSKANDVGGGNTPATDALPNPTASAPPASPERGGWLQRLRKGLARTGQGLASVFTGARVDAALYEELESALLMADAGVQATEHLMKHLQQAVKSKGITEAREVQALLEDLLCELLLPLEKPLSLGQAHPSVIMVTSGASVLLAAADTFRAAAREQLEVWADRSRVDIVSQAGGDPAAVAFDAVSAGKARGKDVVIVDTAGRLPTQTHLMEELKKIKRVVQKADPSAPHEVLLVIDGNTGQNALAQVQAFDQALGLTGLIVTKLDGTAKGGVLAAIALWSLERQRIAGATVPVYFIGVGESLEDLQTFSAREFSQAVLGSAATDTRAVG